MLEQLWDYWRYYQSGRWSALKASNEVRYWMEQHCVAADDFALQIALFMYAFLKASGAM